MRRQNERQVKASALFKIILSRMGTLRHGGNDLAWSILGCQQRKAAFKGLAGKAIPERGGSLGQGGKQVLMPGRVSAIRAVPSNSTKIYWLDILLA
jgi:hypothetical protein